MAFGLSLGSWCDYGKLPHHSVLSYRMWLTSLDGCKTHHQEPSDSPTGLERPRHSGSGCDYLQEVVLTLRRRIYEAQLGRDREAVDELNEHLRREVEDKMTRLGDVHGLVLTQLEMTCGACPSQWEGRLLDGRFVYVRYRWGCLAVGMEATMEDAIMNRELVLSTGDNFHGVMSTKEMLAVTGFVLGGQV